MLRNTLALTYILFIIILVASRLEAQYDINFYADVMISAQDVDHKHLAERAFTELLVEELKSDTAFQREWNWAAIPVVYSPDSSFRFISWWVESENPSENRVTGLLQYRGDTTLTSFTNRALYEARNESTSLSPRRWIGAVYSQIYSVPELDSVYMLYGRNIVDEYQVLHVLEIFDFRNNSLSLGLPLWENEDGSKSYRKTWVVARGAQFPVTISSDASRIVVDHLRPVPYNQDKRVMVNVPDGTYVFYEWKKDRWEYNDRLFDDDQDRVIRNPENRKEAAGRDLFGNPRN